MKTLFAAALAVSSTAFSQAQEPAQPVAPAPVTQTAPASTSPAPASSTPARSVFPPPTFIAPVTPATPPIVRVPGLLGSESGSGVGVAAPGAGDPLTVSSQPPQARTGSGQGETGLALARDMEWSKEVVEMRPAVNSLLRTNPVLETRPLLPRMTRPERKGFGGFVSSFANLFNPFAPVEDGVAARTEHWYDASINPAPVPRGMRDERFHEPQGTVVLLGLDGNVKKPASPP